MPGDHFPICSVKDFADPKVAETLKKIQGARAREKKPEKAGDSGRPDLSLSKGAGDSGRGARDSGAAPEKNDGGSQKPK